MEQQFTRKEYLKLARAQLLGVLGTIDIKSVNYKKIDQAISLLEEVIPNIHG